MPYAPTNGFSCLDHTLLNIQGSTVYSGPRTLFRDLRKVLKGSVFTNTCESLSMRDSQLKNIEAYSSG